MEFITILQDYNLSMKVCGEQHLAKHLPKLNARKTCSRVAHTTNVQTSLRIPQSDPLLWHSLIYLRKKKKRNKRFDLLLAYNVMSVLCVNDVNSWEWYVTVKLRQLSVIINVIIDYACTLP